MIEKARDLVWLTLGVLMIIWFVMMGLNGVTALVMR